jgi:hypothetical protein
MIVITARGSKAPNFAPGHSPALLNHVVISQIGKSHRSRSRSRQPQSPATGPTAGRTLSINHYLKPAPPARRRQIPIA